jgi:hypothetical protein
VVHGCDNAQAACQAGVCSRKPHCCCALLPLLYCNCCFFTDTLPSPPPSAVSRQLSVYSTEGVRASVTVLPGVTTVGQLREQVAEALRSNPAQVRHS